MARGQALMQCGSQRFLVAASEAVLHRSGADLRTRCFSGVSPAFFGSSSRASSAAFSRWSALWQSPAHVACMHVIM